MKILFLCVANSARSQMAEGIARKIFAAKKDVAVFSAGTEPSKVNPLATKALEEIDIDSSNHRSKNVSEFLESKIDVIITLCAEEKCPNFSSDVEKLHWPLPDPVGDPSGISSFRNVRDSLFKRLTEFGKERNLL